VGLSVSASSAILFIGFIFVATALFGALNMTLMDIQENYREAQELQAERSRTSIHVDDVNNDTSTVFINVTNEGAIALKVSQLQLLVDGNLSSDSIAKSTVEGDSNTDIWAPEETLYLEVTYKASGSERIMVWTGNGVGDTEVLP
jgi:flagellar protein FlaF